MAKILVKLSLLYFKKITGEECMDDRYCENYIGYEDFYCQRNWVKNNCRKMCGLCGGI